MTSKSEERRLAIQRPPQEWYDEDFTGLFAEVIELEPTARQRSRDRRSTEEKRRRPKA